MSFLLAIFPQNRDISPVFDCLAREFGVENSAREFSVEFRVKSTFDELAPFAENYAMEKELIAKVGADQSPVVAGPAVPPEDGQINDILPRGAFSAHVFFLNEATVKEEVEDVEIKEESLDRFYDWSANGNLPDAGDLSSENGGNAMGQKPKRRKSYRAVRCKKLYGDFVGDDGNGQKKRKKCQKEEKGERLSRSRRIVSGDVSGDEAADDGMEEEERDQTADKDDTDNANDEKACPFDGCSEKVASSEDKEEHMKKHQAPWICRVCKRQWPGPGQLLRHYRTHTGETAVRIQDGIDFRGRAGY